MRRSLRIPVMGTYFGLCFLAQIWPVATVANRIDPRVLGLPFLFFWYVAWVGAIFAGFVVLYVWERADASEGRGAPGRVSDAGREGGRLRSGTPGSDVSRRSGPPDTPPGPAASHPAGPDGSHPRRPDALPPAPER